MKAFVVLMTLMAFAGCASAKKNTTDQTAAKAASSSGKTTTEKPAATLAKPEAHHKKHSKTVAQADQTKTDSGKATTEKPAAKTGANAVTCKSGEDERKLEITEADGGCKLSYTKEGKASDIANQKAGDEKCREVSERIQKKLTDAGYECK